MARYIYHFSRHSIQGWTKNVESFHISELIDHEYSRRSFTIIDRDHPYTLRVLLKRDHVVMVPHPLYLNIGFVLVPKTLHEQPVTRRYPSKEAVIEELEKIEELLASFRKHGDRHETLHDQQRQ